MTAAHFILFRSPASQPQPFLNMIRLAFILVSLVVGTAAHANEPQPLQLGAALPSLTVTLDDGSSIDLASADGGYTLIYFYPKADTPGCTKQACSLRDAYAELTEKGVTVFGASFDDAASQAAFREKFDLPFPLVADVDGALADAFGVPVRGGRFAARQAFLFNDGVLVWRDLRASTGEQAADVLAAIPAPAE